MNVYQNVTAFLNRHGFAAAGYDVNTVVESLLYDMEMSLTYGAGDLTTMAGSQDMIPTWGLPPSEAPENQKVIVIDAGGTNFRSCLVTFDADGKASISDLEKTKMPGIEREFKKDEFFDAIAANLDHLKDKADRIGFCFSYAMEITPDGDGRALKFSKEIKAKEVEGCLVGDCLSDALVKRGWKRPAKITLLNDTTAALLAGASTATEGRAYSSYVGFILGTGMNTAYIESEPIAKIASMGNVPKQQIVVCESGRFNKVQRSDFDIAFDKSANTPGLYVMEKMCSGAYLGKVAFIAVKQAAEEGLFSEKVANAIRNTEVAETYDADRFLYAPRNPDTVYGKIIAGGTQQDADTLYTILDLFVERSARLSAALIAAAVIKSGMGTSAALPVGVVCNGTTFEKTHNLKERFTGYLNDVLISQRHLYYQLLFVENDITLGAAVAGAAK